MNRKTKTKTTKHKKVNTKIKKTKKKRKSELNFTLNFESNFYENTLDKGINKVKTIEKKLFKKLYNSLEENQWIKVSKDKFKYLKVTNLPKQHYDIKPYGFWFSKGGWLFYELCCNIDNEIILADVDYSKIYTIKTKKYKSNVSSNDKYYNNKLKKIYKDLDVKSQEFCFDNKYEDFEYCYNLSIKKCKTDKKCNLSKLYFANWGKIYKSHYGFAIYPYNKSFHSIYSKDYKEGSDFLLSYDVESLVLWNSKPVISYRNLGTIREILENCDKKYYKLNNIQLWNLFIDELVKKIKQK